MTTRKPFYLEPPHLQLGFYWDERDEVTLIKDLLRWLVDYGYELESAIGLQASSATIGEIYRAGPSKWPRLENPPKNIDPLAGNSWVPLMVRLLPNHSRNMDIMFNLAAFIWNSADPKDRCVFEIVASGASLAICNNAEDENLSGEIREEALRMMEWETQIFTEICNALYPSYAGSCTESELPPPTVMVVEDDLVIFSKFYLSSDVYPARQVLEEFAAYDEWNATALSGGVLLERQVNNDDSPQVEQGSALIKQIFRKRFG